MGLLYIHYLMHITNNVSLEIIAYLVQNPLKHTKQKSIDIYGFANPNQNANYISNLLMVSFQITNSECIYAINNHYAPSFQIEQTNLQFD